MASIGLISGSSSSAAAGGEKDDSLQKQTGDDVEVVEEVSQTNQVNVKSQDSLTKRCWSTNVMYLGA